MNFVEILKLVDEFGYLLIMSILGFFASLIIIYLKTKENTIEHPINFFSEKDTNKTLIKDLNTETTEKVQLLQREKKDLLKLVEHVSKQKAKIMSSPSREHQQILTTNKRVVIVSIIVAVLLVSVIIFIIINPMGWSTT